MTIENKMIMLEKKSSDFMFLFFDAAPTKKVKLFQELFLFSHLVFIIEMICVNVVVVVVVEPWTSLRTYQCIRAFTQRERERERGGERGKERL